MQNDPEGFASILMNNPFWELFNGQFESIEPQSQPELPELSPPSQSLSFGESSILGIIIILAAICYVFNKKMQKVQENKFPEIYFDEQRQWYYYQFSNHDPSLITGQEVWIPGNYYFDVEAGEFFFDNEGNPEKATLAQLRKAAFRGTPTYILPLSIILIGFLGAGYLFNLNYLNDYSEYLAAQSQQQNAASAFNPYAGMCRLNEKNSLIPNLMSVQVAYDLPEGNSPPLAVETHYYLEGDELSAAAGDITLPALLFLHDSPEQIVGDSAANINFRDRATGGNCIEGNTIFLESDPISGEPTAYRVPVDDLKSLSLGESSGSYESKLFGRYDSSYMLNLSSYDLRTVEYRYSVDDLPGCNTVSTQEIMPPDYQGVGDGFKGEIVPWGTPMTETINLPNFQSCSSIYHLEYQ